MMIHPAILIGGIAVMVIVAIIVGQIAAHLSRKRWIGFVAGLTFFLAVDQLLSFIVVYD